MPPLSRKGIDTIPPCLMPPSLRTFLAMKRPFRALALLFLGGCATPSAPSPSVSGPRFELPSFRLPAIPLFVQTPYLHTWLCGDRLADESPKLWNGQIKGMAGLIRIDGKAYRFMGLPTSPLPALRQEAVRVLPTRTLIDFSQDDVHLRLEFLSPMDPRDLRLLSLPVGLLRAEVSSLKPRSIQLYFDITGEWAVGSSDRRITWDGCFRVRPSQPRIFHETHNYPDWGEIHWVPVDAAISQYGVQQDVRQAFVTGGSPTRDTRYPRPANDDWPVFAHSWDLGRVDKPAVRRLVLGHARRDAVIDFHGTGCPAYWSRHYETAAEMISAVVAEFESIRRRAEAVDNEVVARAHAAGGTPLACLAALAFRQTFAANELVLHHEQVFYAAKSMDISGESAIQSLDMIYPASSALLAFNPALLRYQLAPFAEALSRGDWREPHVMSNLGAYPSAAGQLGGGAPRPQSTAALAILMRLAGGFEDHPQFKKLAPSLLDAEPTLRIALARATPDPAGLKRTLEAPSSGIRSDFFIDRLLGLRRIGPEESAREVADVVARLGRHGAPFDARRQEVHADALMWIAALGQPEDRESIAFSLLRFYSDTAARVPAPDRYEADTLRPAGTQARPAIGAVFAPILLHEARAER